MHMSNSIPDGLSTADLQAMLSDAVKPDSNDKKPLSHKEIGRIVIPAVEAAAEKIGDVSAYKHITMFCLAKLYEFHNEVSLECMDDDKERALCWGRDAGWLQVCMNTLRNIHCGPQDTWANDDE